MTHTFGGVTYSNGGVPATVLAPLDGPYAGYSDRPMLRRDAAAAWNRARAEVLAETGVDLVVRGWNRTYQTQVTFYLQRHRLAGPGERVCCYWQGRPYVFTGVGHAAPPGTSNHGWGLAVDVVDFGGVGDWTNPRRAAAWPILARHGWTDHEGRGDIQEPWHIVYDPARDTRPTTPTQEDDMFTDEDRALLKAAATNSREASAAAGWSKTRLAGTNARNEDGTRKDSSISEDLHDIRRYARRAADRTAALQASVKALSAAVETLAENQGLDPKAITAAIDKAVTRSLADLSITLTTEDA